MKASLFCATRYVGEAPHDIWPLSGEHYSSEAGVRSMQVTFEARTIMEKLGYGRNKRLAVTVSTRDSAGYRDPAVIAIDQMKETYIDGTLEVIETANWFPKVVRKDYTIGINVSETVVDDLDKMFYENYACGPDRNYTGYADFRRAGVAARQRGQAQRNHSCEAQALPTTAGRGFSGPSMPRWSRPTAIRPLLCALSGGG